jgi:hypothetical protein
MTNPRFLHLMAAYAKFDTITLVLAGVALGAVLLAWIFRRSPAVFYAFYILVWLFVLAGSTYILLGGSL